MARSLNKVQLIGNLTQDPEIRQTPSGQSVSSVTVATNRRWTGSSGETQEKAEFHNIVLWGKLAEIAGQYLRKGSKVYIEGRLETRSWEAQDGTKRYKTEVVAEKVILIDRFERGQLGAAGNAGGGSSAPSYKSQSKSNNSKSEAPSMPQDDIVDNNEINPDDLPF